MESTFTATWLLNSTDSRSINPNQLREALESSLSLAVAMERVARQSSERPEQVLTAHLSISLTSKGLLHVTYTEEPTST